MYPSNADQFDSREELYKRSEELVKDHWLPIEALAKELWTREWLPQVPVAKVREKRIDGTEVVRLLKSYGISAIVFFR